MTSSVTWYWRRLQSMSPPEVAHRLREAARRQRYRLVPPPVPRPPLSWTGVASVLGDLVLAWAAKPETEAYARARTEQWLGGDVELMGYHWPSLEGEPRWHEEPFTGRRLPLDYCFDVDYRHGSPAGEVRLVWELNRLLWLLPAAAQAVLGRDAELAGSCDRVVDAWLAANPPRRGVNWSAGIEISHHVVALLTLEDLIGRVLPDPQRRQRRMERLAVMVDWIGRFPSLFSSANNHRITELAATLVAGCCVAGSCPERRFRAAAAELGAEAASQHADGCNAEQAPHYGAFTLEWLATAARVASAAGRPLPPGLGALLPRAAAALAAITDARGHAVSFGDDDGASLLSFTLPPQRRMAAVLELAGLDEQGALAARAPGLRQLGPDWYTVARSADPLGETLLVFDHAPLGYGSLAAHGHADALAIWLSVAGQPLLVEAGTYLYHSDPARREWFRSTRAHNTLTVAGLDSSVPSGPFNWRRDLRARCELLAVRDEPLYLVEASHDGYASRLGTRHVRTVARVGEGRFRIEDRLSGTAAHPVEAAFVLDPALEACREGQGWTLTRPDGARFSLGVSSGYELHEARGSGAPFDGWCSPEFAHLRPTWILRALGELGGSRRLVFELDVSGGKAPRPEPPAPPAGPPRVLI